MTEGVKSVISKAIELDADIYHLHDPELLTQALKLKRLGKAVIFDSHECYSEQIRNKEYLPSMLAALIAECYFLYETHVVKRIDGVIFPCLIEESGIDNRYSFENRAKRIAYVNNYPKVTDMERDPGIEQIENAICYAGGLTPSRGIKQLADAAEICGAKLLLAGPFSDDEFRNTILSVDHPNVVYKGVLKNFDMGSFYSLSKIGMSTLLPVGQYHKSSNLPTKVYEYMCVGMPVIISDFPYNRQFFEKHKAGLLVNPLDPEDIAEKIKYLLDHPQEAKLMGETGREVFLKECSWPIAEKELLKLYKAVEQP